MVDIGEGSAPLLIFGKKKLEKEKEGKLVGQAPFPPPPNHLAQSLDPPLTIIPLCPHMLRNPCMQIRKYVAAIMLRTSAVDVTLYCTQSVYHGTKIFPIQLPYLVNQNL